MATFGGISVYSCPDISNVWIFALVSLIIQTFIFLLPMLIKIYVCLCNIKTPCCCVDTDYYLNEIEDDNEV